VRKVLLILLVSLAAAGCGGSELASAPAPQNTQARSCPTAWQAGWQRLADRIDAPVYCPSWMPSPLTAEIRGPWNNINSVDPDRSYLIGFVWQEKGQEIHVNLRAYPGVTRIPTCRSIELVGGKKHESKVPCFSDKRETKRIAGVAADVFTVNQDADQWHVLYAWRHEGSLYTLSQHIAPPMTFPMVIRTLDRMMRSLVLVEPK
jgi:hypothetical protein